jgi:hypothetical protein
MATAVPSVTWRAIDCTGGVRFQFQALFFISSQAANYWILFHVFGNVVKMSNAEVNSSPSCFPCILPMCKHKVALGFVRSLHEVLKNKHIVGRPYVRCMLVSKTKLLNKSQMVLHLQGGRSGVGTHYYISSTAQHVWELSSWLRWSRYWSSGFTAVDL